MQSRSKPDLKSQSADREDPYRVRLDSTRPTNLLSEEWAQPTGNENPLALSQAIRPVQNARGPAAAVDPGPAKQDPRVQSHIARRGRGTGQWGD
jgi:hypothetical protein